MVHSDISCSIITLVTLNCKLKIKFRGFLFLFHYWDQFIAQNSLKFGSY
jgi:hypothetical protein